MPTIVKLQWHKATKRWRKKINGKDYYFIGGKGTAPSNMEGYRKAWQEYLQLVNQMDTPPNGVVSAADKLRYYQAIGDTTNAALIAADIEARNAAINDGEYQPLEDGFINSHFFYENNRQWRDRVDTINAIVGNQQSSISISAAFDKFLLGYANRQKSGKGSAGRLDLVQRYSKNLILFSNDIAVSAINSATMTQVYNAIIANTDWSGGYQKAHWIIFKKFVNYSWEQEYLENLPRNFNSKDWVFADTKAAKPKLTFTQAQLDSLIKGTAPDKIKLWVLLALNCGFTQVDISELTKDEVDWDNGVITRKRSKTKKAEGTPIVTYKLWPITFSLLKKLKSKSGKLALTTRNGTPLIASEMIDGKYVRKDIIARTMYLWQKKQWGKTTSFKSLRKTGCTQLNGSDYRDMRSYYLGHSPRSIAEKHYDVDSPAFRERFNAAVEYIGKSLDII